MINRSALSKSFAALSLIVLIEGGCNLSAEEVAGDKVGNLVDRMIDSMPRSITNKLIDIAYAVPATLKPAACGTLTSFVAGLALDNRCAAAIGAIVGGASALRHSGEPGGPDRVIVVSIAALFAGGGSYVAQKYLVPPASACKDFLQEQFEQWRAKRNQTKRAI